MAVGLACLSWMPVQVKIYNCYFLSGWWSGGLFFSFLGSCHEIVVSAYSVFTSCVRLGPVSMYRLYVSEYFVFLGMKELSY